MIKSRNDVMIAMMSFRWICVHVYEGGKREDLLS